MPGKVLDDIVKHSLAMASKVRYDNVGTWEWIVTPAGQPFLMEVNTRIQVEKRCFGGHLAHPRPKGRGHHRRADPPGIGRANGLTTQKDISFEGVGIEYRIIAESPEDRFTPWVGRIDEFSWNDEPWLKMHTQIPRDEPYDIPTEYDPNLALAIIWGNDLQEAKDRGVRFLDNLVLRGENREGEAMRSNVAFLRDKTHSLLEF